MSRSTLDILLAFGLAFTVISCGDKDTSSDTDDVDTDPTETDADGDGSSVEDGDCDDTDPDVNPSAAEICDGVDNDCDSDVDEDVTTEYYADSDGDGFGDAGNSRDLCDSDDGWVPNDDDCDDSDDSVYEGANEECDGVDNDCDGDIDEDLDASTYYADDDGDGYGDPDDSITGCDEPSGYVENDMDCDDRDAAEPVHVSQDGPVSRSGTRSPDTGCETGETGCGESDLPGSASNPYEHIQEGIDAANTCVYVWPGDYEENITFNGNNILVMAVEGAGETTITGGDEAPTVTFNTGESSDAVLDGFTVTGGGGEMVSEDSEVECESPGDCTLTTVTYMGACIFVDDSQPTITDSIITGCELAEYDYTQVDESTARMTLSMGGGVYVTSGNPSINRCTISDNYADAGGGVWADSESDVRLVHSIIDGNGASAGGGVWSEGNTSAMNSIFVNNISTGSGSSLGGAAIDTNGTLAMTNVSAAGNDGMASIFLGASSSNEILNSILVENSDGYVIDGASGHSTDLTFSDLYNSDGSGAYGGGVADNTGTDGLISRDPLFNAWTDDSDSSDDDFTLDSASPAIDAGNPAAAYRDLDGTDNDMGAFGGPYGSWP